MSDDIRAVLRLLVAFFVGSGAGAASASVPPDDNAPGAASPIGDVRPDGLQVAQATVQDLEDFLEMYATGAPRGVVAPPRAPRTPEAPPRRTQTQTQQRAPERGGGY